MQSHEIIFVCKNLIDHLSYENKLLREHQFQEVTLLTNNKEILNRSFQKIREFLIEHPEWLKDLPQHTSVMLKESLEAVKVVAEENEKQLAKIFAVSQKLLRSVTESLQNRNQLTKTYTALGTIKKKAPYSVPSLPAMAYDEGY